VRSTFLERYVQGASPIHRLDARAKLLATVVFVLATSLTPPCAWHALALLGALALAAIAVSRISLLEALKRSSLVLPFAGMVAVSLPFTRAGEALWSAQLFGWTLTLTDQGLQAFATLLVKAWLSVWVSGLLVATTPFPDLLAGMRGLCIPNVLVTLIGFTYRYLFVLVDEAARLQTARDARSVGSGGTVLWRARVLGSMVGSLFIRSYERSERIYQAMASRGYAGQMVTMAPPAWRRRDIWIALAWVAALATILVLGFTAV
jgi:cobalt/nickel transport system permease protein